jgi:hypothetical protein
MAIVTLANDILLLSIKEEDDLTRSRLEVNPLTAALAVPFAAFMAQRWQAVFLQEHALSYELALATASVLHQDRTVKGLVKKLDSALLMVTGKDRAAPLYTRFFGRMPAHEVAACPLGPRLETMRGWPQDLSSSPHEVLQAVGAEMEAAVAAAFAAMVAKRAAEAAARAFELTGERAQLVDAYNALRKETYGALGKLRHQHPGLPADFADSFFRHEKNRGLRRKSPEELKARIDALAAQKAALEKKLKEALELETARSDAKRAAEQEQKQAALAARRREKEALDAAIAKMEGEIPSRPLPTPMADSISSSHDETRSTELFLSPGPHARGLQRRRALTQRRNRRNRRNRLNGRLRRHRHERLAGERRIGAGPAARG